MGCFVRILVRLAVVVAIFLVLYTQRHTVLAHQVMGWFDLGRSKVRTFENHGFPHGLAPLRSGRRGTWLV